MRVFVFLGEGRGGGHPNRAGITFGVELYVPWDAPEMVVDPSSASAVPLRNVPDVFGMIGRRDSATESRSSREGRP